MAMRSGLTGWARRVASSPLTVYILSAAILLLIIVHQLGAQPAGLNPAELAAQTNSSSLSHILDKPINAPHNLLAYGLHAAGLGWRTALRLSSASFASLFLFCFCLIIRAWFGKSVGIMGTIILASTPIFLVMARQGSAEIMFFSVCSIMASYAWIARSEKKDMVLILFLAACALCLYTPGIIWWLAAAIIIGRRKLADIFSVASPIAVTVSVLLGLLLLAPLGLAIARDWTLIKPLALIPSHFAPPLETLKHLIWMTSAYFVKAPYHNALIMGRLPALSVIQDALLVFGVYALFSAARVKLILMLATVSFAILAAGINDNFSLLALGVPALAVTMSAGLRYLYIEWRSIFPKNPVARGLAFSMMWIIVLVQLLFGIRYGVIAWPSTHDTKASYVLK